MTERYSPPSAESLRTRRALWTVATIVVLAAGYLAVDVVSAGPPDTPNRWTTVGQILAIVAAGVAGLALIRRRRVGLGVGLLLASILAVIVMSVFQTAGLGILVGMIAMMVAVGLAAVTLTGRQANWAVLMGMAAGLAAVLIDLFGPPRTQSATDPTAILVFAGAMLLFFGAFIVRRYRSYSLRNKLVAAFLTVAVIPIGVLGYASVQFTQQALTAEASRAVLGAANQVALSLDTFVDNGLATIRTEATLADLARYLSLPPEARAGSPEEVDAYNLLLALARKDIIFVDSYAVLDLNGRNLLDTFRTDQGRDELTHEYYQVPVETGAAYLSGIVYAGTPATPSIYFSAPVRNSSGVILGVLRARYDAHVLQNVLVRSLGLVGPGSVPILVDENRIRMADAVRPDLNHTSVVPLPPARLAELQQAGRLPAGTAAELSTNLPEFERALTDWAAQATFTGVAHPGAELEEIGVVPMQTRPWLVVYARPRSVFLASLAEQTRVTVIAAVVIAIAVAGVAFLVAYVLGQPILRLTETAGRVAQGDLNARASVETDDEVGALAAAFNRMTGQLKETLDSLEARVADRTRALAASAEVSRRLSTILDRQRLLGEVVEQIQQAFNYYHVHIYLIDEARGALAMVGGTGEVGQKMLAAGHQVPLGKGLVGRAAAANQVVLVSDTSRDPNWLPNPLLPRTKAEVAVPITLGDRVLGVLDVQHNIIDGLDGEDADLLQALASQVAVALQNTRQYTLAQQQSEREALINTIGQKIRATGSVDQALKVAVRELGRALAAPQTRVRLGAGRDDNGHN